MAVIMKLSPPQINGMLPAFTRDGKVITVPFTLSSAIGASQFNKVCINIKTVSTGINKGSQETTDYYYDYDKRCYMARFKNIDFTQLQEGQYYKIQIALADGPNVGYYSSVGIAKMTTEPKVIIKDRDAEHKSNIYEYTGVYSQEGGDPTEKVYNYKFDLYDSANILIATSGIQLHNSANDTNPYEATDTWIIRQALKPNLSYFIQYTIYTINGLERSSPKYEIVEVQYADPTIHADLSVNNNFEEGYMEVYLRGKRDNSYVNGNFILLRSSSEDDYNTQYELTRFELNRWDSNGDLLICKDHTVQQGFDYRYSVQAYNKVGTYSNRISNIEGPIECDFEDAFLFDGERQLKIRFNPKVSSFKNTILETKTDTIGSQHPFIFRNGNVKYKEFAISGLLSMLSDNDGSFLKANEDSFDNQDQWLTAENYRREREFKLAVLEWLTNGKPKLFRSAAEGNYIVRLMNVSLTPNDTVGRMLHTFNATAYEVAEYTFENLQSFGFSLPAYVERRTLQFENKAKPTGKIEMPHAVMVRVSDSPRTMLTYELSDGYVGNMEMPSSGYFEFPKDVLLSTPMVSLSSTKWAEGSSVTWAYYDAVFTDFSYIHKITSTDKVDQLIGENNFNFIEKLSPDIRKRAGAIHYLKIAPRSTKRIFENNGKFYENHDKTKPVSFEDYMIYLIVDTSGTITHYIDGRYGVASKKPISELSYQVKLNGSTTLDVSIANEPLTAASYSALTDIQSLNELYLGDGVMADIVYQENILLYAVEVPESEWVSQEVLNKKKAWEAYQSDARYNEYLAALTKALNDLKEAYDVDFAI